MGPRPRGLNPVYFVVELWRVLDGTMHHSPFRRRWTGGTAVVNGMEERDRVGAPNNFCSRPMAVTGRKYLRPRPVDANRLCCLFTQLWLLLAGDISALARLPLLYLTKLLCDYLMHMYILWTNAVDVLWLELLWKETGLNETPSKLR